MDAVYARRAQDIVAETMRARVLSLSCNQQAELWKMMEASAYEVTAEQCHYQNVQANGGGGLSVYPLFLLACYGKIENTPATCAGCSAIAVSEKKE